MSKAKTVANANATMAAAAAGVLAACADTRRVPASRSQHTLWIGGDLEGLLPTLNVGRDGKVLQRPDAPAVSIAVDPRGGLLYCNDGYYAIQAHHLETLQPIGVPVGPVYAGDMTFAAGKLWVANASDKSLDSVDPVTGQVGREILLPFRPRGVAYDGAGFWVTSVDDDDHLVRVTSSVAACEGADSENCEMGAVEVNFDLDFPVYGVAWDDTDKTLWLGSKGKVVHLRVCGKKLGAFPIDDGRYVVGLEFQP